MLLYTVNWRNNRFLITLTFCIPKSDNLRTKTNLTLKCARIEIHSLK